jgi:predicted MFS family arabinose efflux permease
MLNAALLLLVVGCLASAAAPTFASLIAAQVVLGAGLAGVLGGAVAAAGRWPAPSHRARVLSWALNGQPSAWIVGMPLIGLVSAVSWRLAWLILPTAGGVLALTTLHALSVDDAPAPVAHEVRLSHVLRQQGVVRWALGELLHYTAWSGTLVFAGALFIENLGAPVDITGVLLGVGAAAYLPGNAAARRTLDGTSARPLALMAIAASATVALFGIIRGGLLLGTFLFAVLAFLCGARGFAGSIRGMALATGSERVTLMSVRAAATQFGYLLGATLGGLGLALGGYPGLAATLSVLFALAALPYLFMDVGVASAPEHRGPTPPARAILSPAGTGS